MTYAILWIIALVVLLVIDMVWLLWLGRSFYVAEIGTLLRPSPNLGAAAAFYLLYVTGLLVFVIRSAHGADSVMQALLFGALFGLVAYGTYDLTNLAVMNGFTARIAIIDMIWGGVLTGVTAALTVWAARLLP